MKTHEQRLQALEETADASRHVFRQMTEIAQSDGAPVVQEWGLIDRLGKSLSVLDLDGTRSVLSRADSKIESLGELLRQARSYVYNDCSVGGDELIEKIDAELMSLERIAGLREGIQKHHNWMEGDEMEADTQIDDHPTKEPVIHAIAQGWCEPEASEIEMDRVLAEAIAKPVGRLVRNWYDTAAQFSRNADYYRGIVQEIGAMLGDEAFISDDGSVQDSVLCAKVPELVRARLEAQTRIARG